MGKEDTQMYNAIVFGGSKGIGKAIADSLRGIGVNVFATSRKDVDTSNIDNIKKFLVNHKQTDILVLNTGGPPPKQFEDITEEEWDTYHKQLFLGFCIILQRIKINDGGYVFLISSTVIKEPESRLVISAAYRAAFSEVFKIQSSGDYAKRGVSCINIAPGPTDTNRMRELVENIDEYKKMLPMGRLGEPREIGDFVGSIVQNKIKYLSGVVIDFDGARTRHIF